ncbi:hypothetical protein M407DRAFT_244058 [Tulasnella calospora MUT 4182]|uniref:Uncharacterized protein n=1 Tax=Tulasnella calospora MUT 4182 TaxID=1051891 RepID=A0A0C3QI31_9AGAM|nr:hypothetical protein M407DRAFT_244058 [Tulasnella calospora MUT 4182]
MCECAASKEESGKRSVAITEISYVARGLFERLQWVQNSHVCKDLRSFPQTMIWVK